MKKEIEIPYTTKEERKEKAKELMKQLNIFKPYITGFDKNDEVCYYENFAGFWAWQDEKLLKKIKEIEEKYDCTVYAITHEYFKDDELFTMLLVTDYKDEWNGLVEKQNNMFYAFAYVWNKTYETNSEFGTVGIQSFGGGIRRCA